MVSPRRALVQSRRSRRAGTFRLRPSGYERELVALEHGFDRVHVRLADSTKCKVDLAARASTLTYCSSSLATISSAQGPSSPTCERSITVSARSPIRSSSCFDLASHRGTRWPGHGSSKARHHSPCERLADVDMVDHATRSGIVICTWAPGKYGRSSTSGSSSNPILHLRKHRDASCAAARIRLFRRRSHKLAVLPQGLDPRPDP